MLRLSRPGRSTISVLLLGVLFSTSSRAASDFLSLAVAWSARLESPPLTPPVADNDRVYLSLRNGKVRALGLLDGREAWTASVPIVSAIVVSDHTVVGATKDQVVALDAERGETRWRAAIAGVTLPPASRGGWVVVSSGSDLLALRATNGSLVWRLTLGSALRAGPTIEGDRVYAPLGDGTLVAIDIVSGSIAWRTTLPAAPGSITSVGDRLYLGTSDKFFYALEARDGDRDWRWRVAADVLAPVAVDESRVYYTALDNIVRAVGVGSGVQKWRYVMETRPLAGPVLDEGVLVLSAATDLRAVHASDGTLAGKWDAPAELASAPVLVSRPGHTGGTRAVIVTGAASGDWRVYGLAPSPEPAPKPLKEIPGRPLSPDVLPGPPGPRTPGVPHLP